jgi:hypothetical protein
VEPCGSLPSARYFRVYATSGTLGNCHGSASVTARASDTAAPVALLLPAPLQPDNDSDTDRSWRRSARDTAGGTATPLASQHK